MELVDLLLNKEELPIRMIGKNPVFEIPIHPRLLDSKARIDPDIAHNVFSKAAQEWYYDLKSYSENLDLADKVWMRSCFIPKNPIVMRNYKRQIVVPPGIWEDFVCAGENGFARCLSINRNAGGTLYLSDTPDEILFGYPSVLFTPEKFQSYSIDAAFVSKRSAVGYIYNQHNIDDYPGALFLRNWAILYLNEAMSFVLKNH